MSPISGFTIARNAVTRCFPPKRNCMRGEETLKAMRACRHPWGNFLRQPVRAVGLAA